jgi:shikimate dehydrogenase
MPERVGLLGWPVAHSVSPAMHTAAFDALGLDWRYDLLPVSPDEFNGAVARLVAEGYRGFNVTIPHKAAAFRLPGVRQVSAAARAIGAVNTLTVLPDGTLRAGNTDWRGFAADLDAHGVPIAGATCLVLGTGGSAQAVQYALRQGDAARVTLVSRTPAGRPNIVGYDQLAALAPGADVIVNCTPVGMAPHTGRSPWPDDVPLPPGAALVDLIYNPPVTRLMQQARAAGLLALNGLGMLVWQGALSFEQWTGVAPPLAAMQRAAQHALDNREQ